jgi:hypothetical protein
MVEHHAGNLPRTPLRGTWAHLLLPRAPQPTHRHPGAGPAPLVARRRARRRSLCACQAAAQVCRRPSCQPPTAKVRPSLPRQARVGQRPPPRSPTTATGRTRCATRGRSRGTGVRDPARCGQRGRSGRGHRTPVRPDTCITLDPWTPDAGHRTSARPVGRTSTRRTADADSATNGVAGVRTCSTATTAAAAGWAAQTSLGVQRLRRSATDDGSAVTTRAAALTGQLCSTARHEAAPRCTVLGRLRVERRAGRRASSVMAMR